MGRVEARISLHEFDVEALRIRLQKMSDQELVKFGKAAAFMRPQRLAETPSKEHRINVMARGTSPVRLSG